MSHSGEALGFKRGIDLVSPTEDDDETVTCVACGKRETDEAAYDNGWQLGPAVCPDCLRWRAVAEDVCSYEAP